MSKTPEIRRPSTARHVITAIALMAAATGVFFLATSPALATSSDVSSLPTTDCQTLPAPPDTVVTPAHTSRSETPPSCPSSTSSTPPRTESSESSSSHSSSHPPTTTASTTTKSTTKKSVAAVTTAAPTTKQVAAIPVAVSAGQHTTADWQTPTGGALVAAGALGLAISAYRRRSQRH